MSVIISKVPSLAALRFHPMGSKIVKHAKVVCVGRVVVAVDAAGKIHTNGVANKVGYTGLDSMRQAVMEGCVKLGVLSKEAMDEHIAHATARKKIQDARWAAKMIGEHADCIGIKLTAAQLKKVEAASKAEIPEDVC